MWTIIIIILVVLWLFGAFGNRLIPRIPKFGNWVHVLIVIAAVLLLLKLLTFI